jgi:hypothetical protein
MRESTIIFCVVFSILLISPCIVTSQDDDVVVPVDAAEIAQRQAAARQETAAERAEINVELDRLAKGMAESLADPHFRNYLRKQIKDSQKREKILRLEQFLDKAAKDKDMPEKAKAHGRLDEVRATRKKLGTEKHLGIFGTDEIDIYFPVPEHRKKWTGKDDLLVAFSPVGDESEITEIVAYSVKNGKRVVLDAEEAPETPVIVVTLTEHETLDVAAPAAPPAEEPEPTDPESVPEGAEPPLEGGRVPVEGNSRIEMQYIKIYDDKEPWHMGAPEIFVVCTQVKGSGQGVVGKRDLARVNETHKWYWVRDIASWLFEEGTYWNYTEFAVWERDGVSPAVVPLVPLLGAIYYVSQDDDFVCKRQFNKSSVPYNGRLYLYMYPESGSGGYMYAYKTH